MIVKQVNLKDFSDELRKYAKDNIELSKQIVFLGCVQSIPMLVEKSPVDTGLYAASWDVEEANGAVFIGNTAPHAGIIEFGTRPYKPPIGPLLAWAKRVLTNTTTIDEKTGKERKVKTGNAESGYSNAVWALAIGTQKKIQKEGMKPKHILRDSVPDIIKNIEEGIKKIA